MRKASKIIYLVAAILSIVLAVNYLIAGIVLVVVPNTQVFIDAFIENYAPEAAEKMPVADALAAVQAIMITYGVGFIITACCAGVNSFFAFKAHGQEKPSKSLNVLNIVFGVLGGVLVNVVAAIFAFVANGQEERRAAVEKK